jgi:hypothetical protein
MTNQTTSGVGGELRRELKRILFKTAALRAVLGVLSFVAVAAWIFLLAVVWIALAGDLSMGQALFLSRAAILLAVAAFGAAVIVPLVRLPTMKKLAFELERRRNFDDLVAAGYEFSESDEAMKRYSPDLVREVIRRAVLSIEGLQVRFLFAGRRLLVLVPAAYAALAILVVVAALSPGLVFETATYVAAPEKAARLAGEANLYCYPGDATVLAGTDVVVAAREFGGSSEPVALSHTVSNGFWKTEPTVKRDFVTSGETTIEEHVYTFEDIRGDVSYYFTRGASRSPTYTIRVVHKPVVTDLTLVLTPPPYTGEAPDTLVESGGNVSALEGTRVEIQGKANNLLAGAWMMFDGSEKKPARIEGRGFEADFTAVRDGTYSIVLRDSLGHETEDPLVYTVDVFEDRAPVLDVLQPGDDAMLPRNLRVDLGFTAADDYGVREAAVFHRKGGEEKFEKTPIPLGEHSGARELLVAYQWSLEGTTLFPGDYVEYYVEIKDNNVVTGPGVAKSPVYRINVPTMAELYARSEAEGERRTDIVEQAIEEGENLKEKLEKLEREMKKTGEMDWSRRKEIDNALSSQEKIQDMLEEIQKSLDESLESLSENRMTSQEIGKKLEEINKLIEEIDSEELNKYIEEMRDAMAKLDPEKMRQAMENMNLSTEDLLKNLERTEALLKEIQREQRMEEMVRKTRDLMEAQEEISENTAKTENREEMDKLSREQEELSEQAEELEKNLDEFSAETDDKELAEKLQKASEKSSKSRTSKEMKEASSQLQQGQKNQAQSHQEQAMDNLVGLFGELAEIQMQMQSASQNRLAANLQRLANNTLDISFRQEDLAGRIRATIGSEGEAGQPMIRELAEEQQMYERAVSQIADELFEISKENIMIPDRLMKNLGSARESMASSMLFLEQNKAFMASTGATQATTTLNQTTIDLLRTCKNCSGGGSGTPQSSPLLQRLLSGQQQLLQESEHLIALRASQEKLRQEMQAEVQRLAGEQRSLKDIAEKMQKDFKQNERTLGRVDKIVEEMEEVIKDLESGKLDEETLDKEERILSRLLDAQRSVHARDYEKERVSAAAGDVFSEGGAAAVPPGGAQALREEIRRAMELKAPGEFEDLIRLYFRALAEESQAAPGGGASE